MLTEANEVYRAEGLLAGAILVDYVPTLVGVGEGSQTSVVGVGWRRQPVGDGRAVRKWVQRWPFP